MKTATFAAGCFWGVEHTFARVAGVTATEVGYTGGAVAHPTYEQVCSGRTGHAEAVRVTFDPAVVSYEHLLGVFWACHDPTEVNRQGPDVGTQYRSAIFVHDEEQEAAARTSKGSQGRPVATEITAAAAWWRAEDYHQGYLARRGGGACGV